MLLPIGFTFIILFHLTFARSDYLKQTNPLGTKEWRIVNGTPSTIIQAPYLVVLKLTKVRDKERCGSSIISRYWAVTAAHCLFNESTHQLLRYNDVFLEGNTSYIDQRDGIIHGIRWHYVHLNFQPTIASPDFDIGVIRVSNPFEAKYEKPIKLANYKYRYRIGSLVTLSGWGNMKPFISKKDRPTQFRSANISLLHFDSCQTNDEILDSEYIVCAGNPLLDQGSCSGDSGSPLVQNNVLIGIVGSGSSPGRCTTTEYPGMYTRISAYYNWFMKIERTYKIKLGIQFSGNR